MTYLPSLSIGIVAGLRTMSAPAAASWAARSGSAPVAGGPLGFMARPATPWILSALAVGEFIADALPMTPSRTAHGPFEARIVSGALSGAVLASRGGSLPVGALVGAIGAVLGTLGGASARSGLARTCRRDLPAALVEDIVAIIGASLASSPGSAQVGPRLRPRGV